MDRSQPRRRNCKRARVAALCKFALLFQQRQAIQDNTDQTLAIALAAFGERSNDIRRDRETTQTLVSPQTTPKPVHRIESNNARREETELRRLLMRRDNQEFRCFLGVEPSTFDMLVSCIDVNFRAYTPYGEQNGSLVLRKKKGGGGRPRAVNAQVRQQRTFLLFHE
jgi:hypothetical protein